MIKIGTSKSYCTACDKPTQWRRGESVTEVKIGSGNGYNTVISLCDDCKKNLIEKLKD